MDTDFGSSSLWKSALQRTRSDGQAFQSVDKKLFRGLFDNLIGKPWPKNQP
jgi:hypothetical protein